PRPPPRGRRRRRRARPPALLRRLRPRGPAFGTNPGTVSRAQRSTQWCAADPGPSRSVAVPDQRRTASLSLALHRIRDTRLVQRQRPASALPCSRLDRQPDIVFGQRPPGGLRARHIVELGELALAVEGVVAGVEVEELRHPPGE